MTRSERRQQKYEELKLKEAQKITRCCTSATIFKNCKDCANCIKNKIDYEFDSGLVGEKWICNSKARKPMTVLFGEDEKGETIFKSANITGYPYGDINGKCDSLSVMIIEDEL